MNNTLTRVIHVNDIPEELLLEIFKWLPFDELQTSIQLVCKKWRKIASTASLHPNLLLVTEHSNPQKIFYLVSHYGCTLSTIKFQDIHESCIIAILNLKRWSNLETLSLRWKHHTLDPRLPISCLNWAIDQCPKLKGIELRECFVYGSMDELLDKIRQRRIREITFMNTYFVVNGIEKLFELRNMNKFRVYCYFFCDHNARLAIRTFCRYNRHSIRNLGLRVDNSLSECDDVIANSIATCCELRKLHLIGTFKISAQGLRRIASLPKLRYLKLEVRSISCDEFTTLLNLPFARRLTGLAVYWSRQTIEEEIQVLTNCSNLSKLTLRFGVEVGENVIFYVIELVKKLRLRKLTIFASFSIINALPAICSNVVDLFYIKLVQNYELSEKALRTMLKKIQIRYDYEYYIRGSDLELNLKKRIN